MGPLKLTDMWAALLLIAMSFTPTHTQPGGSDMCLGTKYRSIDDYRRSVNYLTTGAAICDSTLDTGWYRFTSLAGGMMPTTCVGNTSRCGTLVPISYEGPMPNEGEIETGQAIEFYQDCRPLRGVAINVKNCSDYLIYYLSPTPGCSLAYCAGDRTPCKVGETSNDGFSPCARVLNITATALLREDKVFNPDQFYNRYMMQFQCDVTLQGPGLDAHTLAEVEFQANGVAIQTTLLPLGVMRGLLEELGPWNMGDIITCKARAVNDSTYSEWSATSTSISTGIRINQTDIDVYMPSDDYYVRGEIKFDLLSPIYCNQNPTVSGCAIIVYFSNPSDAIAQRPECFNPASFSPILLFEKDCFVEVYNSTQHLTQSIKMTVMVDDYISSGTDYDYRDYITLGMVGKQYDNEKWSYYKLTPIKVRVHRTDPNPSVFCYQTPDPHFTSYIKRYFDYHGIGEYVMFKHKIYAIQVNLVFEVCTTCIAGIANVCGAAVRVDRRVLTFNHCGGRSAIDINYYSNGCSNVTTGMRLIQDGTKYEVHIGTGAKFVIQPTSSSSKWYYTWYYPSRLDHLNNTGACGVVGAEFNKDMVKRDGTVVQCPQGPVGAAGYSQSCINSVWDGWKANAEDMLMNGQPGNYNCTSYARTCTCIAPPSAAENLTTEAVCHAVPAGDVCSLSADKLYVYDVTTKSSSYATQGFAALPLTKKRKSTFKVYNASEAYDLCYQGIMQSSSIEVTKQLLSHDDIMATVDFCAFDIVGMGDETPITMHNQALTVAASETMYRNASLWSNSSETGEMVPPEDIATQLCPNSCSGHGNCSDMAVCVCDTNYAGADCSIDLTVPPADMHLLNGDVCDLNSNACGSAEIYGEWFAEGSTCKYRSVSIDGVTEEDPFPHEVPNAYMSISTVRCPLPNYLLTAYGFNISVSNPASVFSEEVFLLIYDPNCRDCDMSRTPPCTTESLCMKNQLKKP